MAIPRWARGPFELLVQAELHFRGPTEQDRRLACILFDNAVEVAIVTYVHLDKTQRGNRSVSREQMHEVSKGFYSAIEFCMAEVKDLGLQLEFTVEDFIHFHRMRNEQYHGATLTVPGLEDTQDLRFGALQIFRILFNVEAVEDEIEQRIRSIIPPPKVQRTESFDNLINEAFDLISVAGMEFFPSEVLYAVDPNAYTELGQELTAENLVLSLEKQEIVS